MNNKDTEAPARSYKDHLREQITNAEEATGYLSACYAEGPETFALAVKDVWEFARVDPPAAPTECFCGTELEAGICPNGHDPITAPPDAFVDEVQHRMDQVVEMAVEWHQAGREGAEWFVAAEKLGAAIDALLELRDEPQIAAMPRRWCSIHNREEFKYEALEHELHSAPPAPDEALEACPPDLIAFKWAETLSTGEQSVLLTSSLKRLQGTIDSHTSVAAPPLEKQARKLTLPELNHISALLETERESGSYAGPREQYYARTERLIKWCEDQIGEK